MIGYIRSKGEIEDLISRPVSTRCAWALKWLQQEAIIHYTMDDVLSLTMSLNSWNSTEPFAGPTGGGMVGSASGAPS